MGVIYVALALDQEVADSVEEYGVKVTTLIQSSNAKPTPKNILNICNQLEGYEIHSGFESSGWQLYIEHQKKELRTLVHLNGVNEIDQHGDLVFEKGAPELILLVLKLLAKRIGSFALFPDDGCEPIVVYPDIDINEALNVWEHTNDSE